MKHLQWRQFGSPGQAIYVARAISPMRGDPELHDHDFYECFLIEAGKGWHRLVNGREPLEARQLVFMRPEQAHTFRSSRTEVLTLLNVAFVAAVVEAFLERHAALAGQVGAWCEGEHPVVVRCTPRQMGGFQELGQNVWGGDRGLLEAEYFLTGLLRLLSRGTTAGREGPAWLWEALALATEAEQLRGGVAALVRLCGRTPEHVARAFRRYLRQTPTEWVTAERMRLARRLLEESPLPVTEVALECGMENLSHFHRCFKRAYGETPLAYRRRAHLAIQGIEPDAASD